MDAWCLLNGSEMLAGTLCGNVSCDYQLSRNVLAGTALSSAQALGGHEPSTSECGGTELGGMEATESTGGWGLYVSYQRSGHSSQLILKQYTND